MQSLSPGACEQPASCSCASPDSDSVTLSKLHDYFVAWSGKPSAAKLGRFLVHAQFQGSVHSSALFLTAAAQNLLCLKLAGEHPCWARPPPQGCSLAEVWLCNKTAIGKSFRCSPCSRTSDGGG